MNKLSIAPSTLVHWSLYGLIVLLMIIIGFGTYLTHQELSNYITKVDHLKIDSEINQQSIENAQTLRRVLDDNRESVERAASIVADTKYYEYQDQIVQDVSSYAAAANLTVLGFDFTSSAASKTSNVKGVKTVMATISLKSPVPYENYIRFLKLIERNLTKMQVTQVEISNDLKNAKTINAPVVTLEVYVR